MLKYECFSSACITKFNLCILKCFKENIIYFREGKAVDFVRAKNKILLRAMSRTRARYGTQQNAVGSLLPNYV